MSGYVFSYSRDLRPAKWGLAVSLHSSNPAFWKVLETIDPNEVKRIKSFLTVIVVVVPFAMLVFYGLAVVMYDQLITASGSWRAVFLPLTESPWLIPAQRLCDTAPGPSPIPKLKRTAL